MRKSDLIIEGLSKVNEAGIRDIKKDTSEMRKLKKEADKAIKWLNKHIDKTGQHVTDDTTEEEWNEYVDIVLRAYPDWYEHFKFDC